MPPAIHSPLPARGVPAGASDLGKIGQEDVTRYIERHARDRSAELLRSGATLSEIGQLLRHESHDTTRIYAKVDIQNSAH